MTLLISFSQTLELMQQSGLRYREARRMLEQQQPPRVLRCKPVGGGALVSVRLTAPRVFASQFRRGVCIEVMPTETEGIFEYDGAVPRRTRI